MNRALIAALVVLACTTTAGAGPTRRSARKPATHTVTIDATRFEPEMLTIKPGDTVVWINKDVIPHTASSQGAGFDSGTIATGASWRHTFKSKGELAYVCQFHPTMKGRLKIQ